MPPTVPINHYFRPAACAQQSCTHTGQQKTGPKVLFCCSMLIYSSKKCACFEHSNFFKVKPQIPRPKKRQMHAAPANECKQNRHTKVSGKKRCIPGRAQRKHREQCLASPPASHQGKKITASRNPTTSFLTATTLVYAIGAGITAAAGTRLALQWILVEVFRLHSFLLPDLKRPGIVIYCHYLPVSGLGNLRACCLPWKW